jgi:hypothetical protein
MDRSIEALATDLAIESRVLSDCIVMDATAWRRVIRGALRGSSVYRALLLSMRPPFASRAAALFEQASSATGESP